MQIGPRPAHENERPYSPGFQTVRPCTSGFIGGGDDLPLLVKAYNDDPDLDYSGPQTVDGVSCTANDLVIDSNLPWQIFRVQTGAWTIEYEGTDLPAFVIVTEGTNYGRMSFVLNGSVYESIGVPYS